MIYPEYIHPGCRIGVTAMSHPADRDLDRIRFENGVKQLKEKGYEVVFTDNVFAEPDRYGRSSSGQERAKQLQSLIEDDTVKAVYSAGGGDFLAEMLPYIDIEIFRKHPKWIQGFSDNTSILYYLTTKGDIATAYGANFGDFGMENWDVSVTRGLQVLEGTCRVQDSFETYQDGFGERETGLEGYSEDREVIWKSLDIDIDKTGGGWIRENESEGDEDEIRRIDVFSSKKTGSTDAGTIIHGRLLGGCMDVLLNLAGTPYDGTLEFLERYKEDGILWYLESFDLHFEQMMEGLWKMKEMGWFRYTNGIIFGRPLFYPETGWDGEPLPSYEDVLRERLRDLNIPIITDADIGHKGPQFVMINGAMAQVECCGGKGHLTYETVVSVETMRKSDAWTIEHLVSSKELMRRAGTAIYESVQWKEPVAVVCGKGNNAGDGYVAASLMHKAGIDCRLILIDDRFSDDGKYYFDICMEQGIEEELYREDMDFQEYGSILDCLLGTGFKGNVTGVMQEVIEKINASGAYVVSADINSGLNGDTGLGEPCVHSDLTVSIGNFKYGHFRGNACTAMKEKINCDIGIRIIE